ncbi:hypothetical protein KAR91_72975 [Candidatus Pacearchaeota archaeon]|nr:hypothetical protein [Candidatus Pacearchaeota archaeon]
MEAYKDQFKPIRANNIKVFNVNKYDDQAIKKYIAFELSIGNDAYVLKSMEKPLNQVVSDSVCLANIHIIKMAALAC